LRAIVEWNEAQEASQRCSLLLHPAYKGGEVDRAVIPSGFLSTPVPPTHIIDLRPHQGKTLSEYLKSIKYRNRAVTFERRHGEVIVSNEFTTEECHDIIKYWQHIADKRLAAGETPTLVRPTTQFISDMANQSLHQPFRSLLFLKVDSSIVGTSVLFGLGSVLTVDIQGLNYSDDLSHTVKAYFVMLQQSIQIALSKGYEFIDFGPTTGQCKMDIGATAIELTGAVYCRSSVLQYLVSKAAKRVDRSHRVTRHDNDNSTADEADSDADA